MRPLACLSLIACAAATAAEPLRIATFQADATPPIGTALCNGNKPPAVKIVDPLSVRGVVLIAEPKPVVICVVDWVGIANASHRLWRKALAEAAGTSVERVAVHVMHPHDAPGCEFETEELLAPKGLGGKLCDVRSGGRSSPGRRRRFATR